MRYLTLLLSLTALLLVTDMVAQRPLDKYFVPFTDKADSPYSIWEPQAYLSPRAIERRQRYGIAITEVDLPVNPRYTAALRAAGAQVFYTSKWMNGAVVQSSAATLEAIRALPFVEAGRIEAVGFYTPPSADAAPAPEKAETYDRESNYYGYGITQIRMLLGDLLHLIGYRGEGMMVGVLDGGFTRVDVLPFFDSLRQEGRLLRGYDFVEGDDYPYESSSHGTQVLSTMAAEVPYLLVGTAPDATYVCVKTEDTGSETRAEEENWVAGLEYADSLGADVVNSSLGYTTFDYKEMNRTYEQLLGDSRAARAANIAYSRGMIVVNSAGNSGGGGWRYIGVPADAENILAVGAVTRSGRRTSFSSYGPTPDGRIKPDVSALGQGVAVAGSRGYRVSASNGTSFSSPITAGMVTSLWQAFPYKTNDEVLDAVKAAGNQAFIPDESLGYGIPNYYEAYLQLKGGIQPGNAIDEGFHIVTDAVSGEVDVTFATDRRGDVAVVIYNATGAVVGRDTWRGVAPGVSPQSLTGIAGELPRGFYQVELQQGENYWITGWVR